MTRARSVLFWVLAAALLGGHLVLVGQSWFIERLWEDEAFNLTVPLNLLHGLGYASDGTLSGSMITPFDPRISTGPVVLLPITAVLATGIEPAIGGRLVMVAFWVLLIAMLCVLARRITGRWGMLVAAAVPLAFTATSGYSPIQGPADVLGEIPAAALLVTALVVLPRRAWLAGLFVGLAIQTKLIVLLVLPAFVVALWILTPGTGWQRVLTTLKRSLLPLLMVGVPTVLFELSALIHFGFAGYIDHLRALRDFVRDGGQREYGETTIGQKLLTLAESWSVPMAVAVAAGILCLALVALAFVMRRPADAADDDTRRLVHAWAGAALVGAGIFIAWWSTASHLPLWVRHPAPAILAFFPVLAVVALWAVQQLRGRGVVLRAASVVGIGVVSAAAAAGGVLHITSVLPLDRENLPAQRAEAAVFSAWVNDFGAEWVAVDVWGWGVPYIVMSGAHVGIADAPSMAGLPYLTVHPCETEVLADGGRYRICAPTP